MNRVNRRTQHLREKEQNRHARTKRPTKLKDKSNLESKLKTQYSSSGQIGHARTEPTKKSKNKWNQNKISNQSKKTSQTQIEEHTNQLAKGQRGRIKSRPIWSQIKGTQKSSKENQDKLKKPKKIKVKSKQMDTREAKNRENGSLTSKKEEHNRSGAKTKGSNQNIDIQGDAKAYLKNPK